MKAQRTIMNTSSTIITNTPGSTAAYHGIGYTALIGLLSKIKVSFIIGSKMAFFGASHCISPLVGYYSGAKASLYTFLARTCISAVFLSSMPLALLFYHIPTLCASLYFAAHAQTKNSLRNRFALATIPLLCFVLFYLHPVGNQALAYTAFWLLPLLSLLIAHKNIFIHALASTFMAHAAGSAIWLYTVGPKTADLWLALIPIVIVERMLFASGMVLCIQLVAYAQTNRSKLAALWNKIVAPQTTANTLVTGK